MNPRPQIPRGWRLRSYSLDTEQRSFEKGAPSRLTIPRRTPQELVSVLRKGQRRSAHRSILIIGIGALRTPVNRHPGRRLSLQQDRYRASFGRRRFRPDLRLPATACSASSAEAPEFDVHLGYEAMPGACAPLTTATMWSRVDNRHQLTLARTSAVCDTASPG